MGPNTKGRPDANGAAQQDTHSHSIVPTAYDKNRLITRRRRHSRELDTSLGVERQFCPSNADWAESAMSHEQRMYAAQNGRWAA